MDVDIAIIGGGIAGLSCAAFMDPAARVVVLETESTFGYHATGRSAALYTECYGSHPIRRLAKASRSFLADRETPLMTKRGVLFTAGPEEDKLLDDIQSDFAELVPDLQRLTPGETEAACPLFPPQKIAGGVFEPGACDIDVDALQTTFIAMARGNGTGLFTNARVSSVTRTERGWDIVAGDHPISASAIVNAAGAWGDKLAHMSGVDPLGLLPLARSLFTFDPGQDPREWPMVVDAAERWYIKPEGQFMIGSAASEIPQEPSDARAQELDVALGIERINTASDLRIRSVRNTWAGLRTFTSDRIPAIGWAHDDPKFFWLVGQGGYGIKTSPAAGQLAAALLSGSAVPSTITEFGISATEFAPRRFMDTAR